MNGLGAALLADGPHASLGEQVHVFDRLVGAWDCHYVHLAEDGSVIEEYDGRVTFGWIIDGWAVQYGQSPHLRVFSRFGNQRGNRPCPRRVVSDDATAQSKRTGKAAGPGLRIHRFVRKAASADP
jgi:hypothetical protein